MKTAQQIIEATRARAASDEATEPPRIALVEFTCRELIAALTPRAAESQRAAELLAGVSAAGSAKRVAVQREHLLIALGALEEDGDAPTERGDAAV